jgi:hypothetical protein
MRQSITASPSGATMRQTAESSRAIVTVASERRFST